MKGTFHYIAEEIASSILNGFTPEIRKATQELMDNYNSAFFDQHILRILTRFIENLVLEANGLLSFVLVKDASDRKPMGLLGKLRGILGRDKGEMTELKMFKSKRVSVNEMLTKIWEFRASIWDEPKMDDEGKAFWASNVDGVGRSVSFGILVGELRSLKGKGGFGGVEELRT